MKQLLLLVFLAIVTTPAFAQENSTEATTQITSVEKVSGDGSLRVHVDSNPPKEGIPLTINLRFIDASTGHDVPHVNYDLVALQNGEPVLSQLGLYTQNGVAQHITASLSTDNHVDVMVILHGIGETAPYSGPQGEMFEARIVPEFGPIVMIVLLVTITAVIVLHKSIPARL